MSKTVNRRTYSGSATYYLGGCVIVIGNGLDLGNEGEPWLPLRCQGRPSAMTLTLAGSVGSLAQV